MNFRQYLSPEIVILGGGIAQAEEGLNLWNFTNGDQRDTLRLSYRHILAIWQWQSGRQVLHSLKYSCDLVSFHQPITH